MFDFVVGITQPVETTRRIIMFDCQVAGLIEQRHDGQIVKLIGAKSQFVQFQVVQFPHIVAALLD